MILPYLTVAPSSTSGRGVFTTKNIPANTIIEISPVIVLSAADRKTLEDTLIGNYIFEWGKTRKQAALALGYISLYNHDYSSNCEYEMDFEEKIMTIKTVRPVRKGEELHINYNATHNDKNLVWFHKK